MLKKELFELLPPIIYFFVALHIVAFIRVLILEKSGSRHPGELSSKRDFSSFPSSGIDARGKTTTSTQLIND